MHPRTAHGDGTAVTRMFPSTEEIDATLLAHVRLGGLRTIGELCTAVGLGRTVVSQRVKHLIDRGLLAHSGTGRSTGGRAPRELRFRSEAACVLGVEVGVTHLRVGLTDLAGEVLSIHQEPWRVTEGAEKTLQRAEAVLAGLLSTGPDEAPVVGIGVGIPSPVEFATGRPVAPPILSGWHDFPLRERLEERFGLPVWIDNEVNMMALGELRAGQARHVDDFLYVKLGTGIGCGVVSGGRLHRGAKGSAGDIAHFCVDPASERKCRCGKVGCLQEYAGGSALARMAWRLAHSGESSELARIAEERGDIERLTAEDVNRAAAHGDHLSRDLLVQAGTSVGRVLADLVNFFGPSLIVIGGGVSHADDFILPSLRKVVFERALPLATKDLDVRLSAHSSNAGVIGAAVSVVDQVLSSPLLDSWPQFAVHGAASHDN
ncbi:ROK family transcriptional regulator [Nonomuraea sp. NPDC050328]|uniref:ROK family transcriptional regulator n=1 Tax=Nonomuraea sp. NPDC050328 TaxID=3364361 RepID=UPI0037B85095